MKAINEDVVEFINDHSTLINAGVKSKSPGTIRPSPIPELNITAETHRPSNVGPFAQTTQNTKSKILSKDQQDKMKGLQMKLQETNEEFNFTSEAPSESALLQKSPGNQKQMVATMQIDQHVTPTQ